MDFLCSVYRETSEESNNTMYVNTIIIILYIYFQVETVLNVLFI